MASNGVQEAFCEKMNVACEDFSFWDFHEFANDLEGKLSDEIVLKLIPEHGFQKLITQTLEESEERRRNLIKTLIAEHIISNEDISPLLKTMHGINRSDEAKEIQALFEGFEREDSAPDSSGKCLGKVIYRFKSITEKQQEHRTLLYNERILDTNMKIRMCHVGRRSLSGQEVKVILLFGKSGAGKTTMINALINHILGVKWEDSFRYKIPVDEEEKHCRSQAYGQTKWISAYFLHGHNIIIVDTPGFQDDQGEDRDKFITEQVRMFFDKQNSQINYVNIVAFVMSANENRISVTQRILCKMMLRLFGRNIEKCICLFATFSEQISSNIPVISAVNVIELSFAKAFQFNNLPLFFQQEDVMSSDTKDLNEDKEIDQNIHEMIHWKWKLTNRELKKCMEYVMKSTKISIDDTAQVLADRKSLDKTLKGILEVIESAIVKLVQLKRDKESVKENQDKIANSEDFSYTVVVEDVEKLQIAPKKAMVCHHCQRTCDSDCSSSFKVFCSAMRYFALFRGCSVCEENCSLHKHERTDYEYKRTKNTITKTSQQLLVELQWSEFKLFSIDNAICKKEKETEYLLQRKFDQVRRCVTRLEQLALEPDTKTLTEYLQDMIREERHDGKDDWEERVELLKKLVKRETKLTTEEGTKC